MDCSSPRQSSRNPKHTNNDFFHKQNMFQMPKMTSTNNANISGKIITLFAYLRILFGLQVVMHNSRNGFLVNSAVQRCLACLWFCFYAVLSVFSQKIEFTAELQIKHSLLVRVLPTFTSAILFVCMTLTLLFTHIYAAKRRRIRDEILKIDETLDPLNISLHPKAANIIAAVGVLQFTYVLFWFFLTGPLQYYKGRTMLERLIGIFPRFVSTFSLLDYFAGVAFLLQQFIRNNKALKALKEMSLHTKYYPKDERVFQQQIMKISQRHRELSKIVRNTNGIFSLLILVNIALLYAFILGKTYIAFYAIFSPLQTEFKIQIASVNFVHLFVNAATLLLLVEITSRLCEEVC